MTAPIRFDGKVALVTGAGGGLGRAYARLLAARGAKVVVNDAGTDVSGQGGSAEPAATVAREIVEQGGAAVADCHSVAGEEDARAIVQTAVDRFGRLDILINNAGTARGARFADLSFADLDDLLAVNLRGVFCVTQPAWRLMQTQGYGRILNTISASVFGFPQSAATSAAKAGVIGLTRALAYEGEDAGIRVNALAPLANTRLLEEIPDQGFREWAAEHCPVDRVAAIAAWLVHEECAASGEIFTAGGGHAASVFLGITRGYARSELTPEDVRDHFDEVRREAGYAVPRSGIEVIGSLWGLR